MNLQHKLLILAHFLCVLVSLFYLKYYNNLYFYSQIQNHACPQASLHIMLVPKHNSSLKTHLPPCISKLLKIRLGFIHYLECILLIMKTFLGSRCYKLNTQPLFIPYKNLIFKFQKSLRFLKNFVSFYLVKECFFFYILTEDLALSGKSQALQEYVSP